MSRNFTFDLFRLNIEDDSDLFKSVDLPRVRTDSDLIKIFEETILATHDQEQETRTALFKWSLRDFQNYFEFNENRGFLQLTLARSVVNKDGPIVTNNGMAIGTSSLNPPLASTATIFVDLARHLVLVEHTGELSNTAWKDFFEKIMKSAIGKLEKYSSIALEAIPEKNGIIGLFKSFQSVTRLKVTLRIPNPELTRYTQSLYDDLVSSNLREITQDMSNPNGMSKSESARPFACAVLAEQGYRKGEVTITGIRGDNYETITSGNTAVKGNIPNLRDFIRGMHVTAKTKETQNALIAIASEVDRIHPIPD